MASGLPSCRRRPPWWPVLFALLPGWLAAAGTERFDYDSLGRLIRHIDGAGVITEYVYDAVGNILFVRRGADSGAPTVSSVAPRSVRRERSATVTVSGSRLAGARLTAAEPALDVSNVRSSANSVLFSLLASPAAPLGPSAFTLATSTGSTSFSITIEPALPALSGQPALLVLTPGASAGLTIALSSADIVARTLTLSSRNAAVASVAPASLTLTPGQLTASAVVTAGAVGTAAIDVRSPALAPLAIGVHVSAPTAGPGVSFAANVGVVRAAVPTTALGPFVSAAVGVSRPADPVTAAQPVGPFQAPVVGVSRTGAGAATVPVGPFLAADVGVFRE